MRDIVLILALIVIIALSYQYRELTKLRTAQEEEIAGLKKQVEEANANILRLSGRTGPAGPSGPAGPAGAAAQPAAPGAPAAQRNWIQDRINSGRSVLDSKKPR